LSRAAVERISSGVSSPRSSATLGEGHGFRKAESHIRALEAEQYFYSRVLGFEPAGTLTPVPIANLD
jgi:hypothetical protein